MARLSAERRKEWILQITLTQSSLGGGLESAPQAVFLLWIFAKCIYSGDFLTFGFYLSYN